jgi:histidinol phosphatase-like PHP family hydrolase
MRKLQNAEIAELLARAAENEEGIRERAYKKAARSAFLWPEEAREILAQGRSLLELKSVGPFIAQQLQRWLEEPPAKVTPPPLRRDFLALADARALLAKHPAWARRLRGDLQMHTQWSDGSGAVAEMAAAANEHKYNYIAITDHAKGLKIAGGIDEKALAEQAAEIAAVNHSLHAAGEKLMVLRSTEMNLNPRGEGDLEPAALRQLDLVLGSFHSALRKSDDQTQRYLAAVRNPHLHVLGHPRGRIYNYRLGLSADWARVFAEATRLDKAVEIDSYPDRQDLNLSLLKIAKTEGVRVSLGTDAHHPWQLGFIELGLAAALRAGIAAERIVNFLPLDDLLQWAEGIRSKSR